MRDFFTGKSREQLPFTTWAESARITALFSYRASLSTRLISLDCSSPQMSKGGPGMSTGGRGPGMTTGGRGPGMSTGGSMGGGMNKGGQMGGAMGGRGMR